MKHSFLGAAATVTGSKTLVPRPGQSVEIAT